MPSIEIAQVTGAFGALTGAAGLILSILAYRRSGAMKALDLRVELRKTLADARSAIEGLPGLFDKANTSRQHVLGAQSLFHSGNHEVWKQELAVDRGAAADLKLEIPPEPLKGVRHSELEARLVAAHRVRSMALRDKYVKALAHPPVAHSFHSS